MALLTENQVRARAKAQTAARGKTARSLVMEAASVKEGSFDVFLSHARVDEELVLGVKLLLEDAKKRVYVDWIDDPMLDRTNVTSKTAAELRKRMDQSASLMYLFTPNAKRSNWMPWELGYFDGSNGNVAVLPVLANTSEAYSGHEFVGLYPYVDVTVLGSTPSLWIHRHTGDYMSFDRWRASPEKLRPLS
jgi:hypothetical protein